MLNLQRQRFRTLTSLICFSCVPTNKLFHTILSSISSNNGSGNAFLFYMIQRHNFYSQIALKDCTEGTFTISSPILKFLMFRHHVKVLKMKMSSLSQVVFFEYKVVSWLLLSRLCSRLIGIVVLLLQ